MKVVKFGQTKVDLEELRLPQTDALLETFSSIVRKAASEAIEIAITEGDWRFSFPAEYGCRDGRGGPPPEDPMTLAFSVPIGDAEFGSPEFSCSLREIVQEVISDNCYPQDSGKIEADNDSARIAISRLSQGFKQLAEMLDESLR